MDGLDWMIHHYMHAWRNAFFMKHFILDFNISFFLYTIPTWPHDAIAWRKRTNAHIDGVSGIEA